jgi:hypothetical protein
MWCIASPRCIWICTCSWCDGKQLTHAQVSLDDKILSHFNKLAAELGNLRLSTDRPPACGMEFAPGKIATDAPRGDTNIRNRSFTNTERSDIRRHLPGAIL